MYSEQVQKIRRSKKVLLADLLWEKNTVKWLADSADKLKRTTHRNIHY